MFGHFTKGQTYHMFDIFKFIYYAAIYEEQFNSPKATFLGGTSPDNNLLTSRQTIFGKAKARITVSLVL